MHSCTRAFLTGILVAVYPTLPHAQEDQFLGGKQLVPSQFYKRCNNSKLAEFERSSCLSDVAKGLKTELKSEIAKKLVHIEAVSDEKSAPGTLGGKEDAANWRRDFLSSQKFWEDYSKLQCKNYIDYENYGGSGSIQVALGCEIRHLVARINEVRSTN